MLKIITVFDHREVGVVSTFEEAKVIVEKFPEGYYQIFSTESGKLLYQWSPVLGWMNVD